MKKLKLLEQIFTDEIYLQTARKFLDVIPEQPEGNVFGQNRDSIIHKIIAGKGNKISEEMCSNILQKLSDRGYITCILCPAKPYYYKINYTKSKIMPLKLV